MTTDPAERTGLLFRHIVETEEVFRTRVSGKAKGMDRQGWAQDLIIYTLLKPVIVVEIQADRIFRSSTDAEMEKLCSYCEFSEYKDDVCAKPQVIAAVHFNGHWDLGAVSTPIHPGL